MFFPEGQIRVFVYGRPVSMRLSYDGLYTLAKHTMQIDPLSGNLFACEFSALRSHFIVGIKAPADCRRNGATRFPALRRHDIVGVMAPPDRRR